MAMAAGAVMRIAGGITGGIAANKRRKEYEEMMSNLPEADPNKANKDWFTSLGEFYPEANKLSEMARSDELAQNLALREKALPGITGMIGDASSSIAPLLRGKLPAGVLNAFTRAGGASTVGLGMGGSGFGALNTGLFGARGAMGAISTGMGLLPSLMSTMPNVSAPTTMGLLSNLMTPQQLIDLQMKLRQQQIGINDTLNAMPTALDSWSQHLNESGAMLMGGGGVAMGGMGGGGGGGFGSFNGSGGSTAGGYSGGGFTGGWGGGSNWASSMG